MKLGIRSQLPEFLPTETRESVSDVISNAPGTCWPEKVKLCRTAVGSKLQSNRIKQGTFEVLEFTMWTTASLSEHMFSAPPVASDVGSNYYWEQFFIGD